MKIAAVGTVVALALVGCSTSEAPQPEAIQAAPSPSVAPAPTQPPPAKSTAQNGPLTPDAADITLSGSVDEVGSDAWWADTVVMSWWGNLSEDDEREVCSLADEHGAEDAARALTRSMNKRLADADTPVDVPTFERWLTKECT